MRILTVDDNAVSCKAIEVFIKKLGHEPIVASSGTEALKIWENERPRLLITDWIMPDMDGLELCRAIREKEGEDYTYIIMLTARDDPQDLIQGLTAGADDYMSKPLNKDELFIRIQTGERVLGFQNKDMVIFALAKLSEARDSDTGNHLERVRHYCKCLSETIFSGPDAPPEMTRQFVDNIFLTSPLHDIGKVGIPDHILLKPGQLDDAEFNTMKTHTIIGDNTLKETISKSPKASYLQMAAEIARSHHEKYDGTGYPDGLSGDRIPLSARLVAMADVYDALISKRVYKDALSQDTAVAIIMDGTGKHFDPFISDAFSKCIDQFNEIRLRFAQDSEPPAL